MLAQTKLNSLLKDVLEPLICWYDLNPLPEAVYTFANLLDWETFLFRVYQRTSFSEHIFKYTIMAI